MRLHAAAVLALLFGCKDGKPAANPDADARAFAESLATDVIPTCDASKLASRLQTPDNQLAARMLCEWYAGIASYKFLGVLRLPAANPGALPHPVMRRLLVDQESGAMFVSYDELTLVRSEINKPPLLADAFSFRQNIAISELLAPNKDSASTDYLGDSAKHDGVKAAQTQFRAGDFEGALKAIDALPAEVKRERGVQMLRVRVATRVTPEAYKQALAELAQTFPNDAGIALIEIDGLLDVDDFDGAMKWIDTLEKTIGVEAYLESMRVVALTRKGDLDKALAAANAAVALEPTLTRALEIKLDVLIGKKKWPEALDVMTELETKHGKAFDPVKLRSSPHLAELVQSKEFADWAAAHTNPQPQP